MRYAAITVLLVAGLLAGACKNDGGEDLGPSGLSGSSKTCQIPCAAVADCQAVVAGKTPPFSGTSGDFLWATCESGVCSSGSCFTDADCSQFYVDAAKGQYVCRDYTCVYPCIDGGCKEMRDKCVDDYCVRQSEEPTKELCDNLAVTQPQAACQCLTDADCAAKGWPWAHACKGGECSYFTTDADAAAVGRPCDDDHDCVRLHMAQDMLATGLALAAGCTLDGPAGQCGAGFVCVGVAVDRALKGKETISPTRAVCLPEACAPTGKLCAYTPSTSCGSDADCPSVNHCEEGYGSACTDNGWLCQSKDDCAPGVDCVPSGVCEIVAPGSTGMCQGDDDCPRVSPCVTRQGPSSCRPSMRECAKNADCPAGEECAWPESNKPGVCLSLACDTCAAWIGQHGGTRKCTDSGAGITPAAIRRPD